jgi:FixJ family two-component response regulator
MSDPTGLLVAVVDDESRMLEALQSLLEAAGHTAHVFESGPAFLESGMLAQADCVITDLRMPGMDGLELQRVVNAVRPRLPIIFMTGRLDAIPTLVVGDRGCRAVFAKPFDGKQLLQALLPA